MDQLINAVMLAVNIFPASGVVDYPQAAASVKQVAQHYYVAGQAAAIYAQQETERHNRAAQYRALHPVTTTEGEQHDFHQATR